MLTRDPNPHQHPRPLPASVTYRYTPPQCNLEGLALQFVWPFTPNLLYKVEPDQGPNWY